MSCMKEGIVLGGFVQRRASRRVLKWPQHRNKVDPAAEAAPEIRGSVQYGHSMGY